MNEQDDIAVLFKEAVDSFETLLDDVKETQPPERPLACGAGCDHCCKSLPEITVTAVETFRLADFISENFEPARIDALIKTLANEPDRTTSWPLAPCPLLNDGRCSVYEARPLICRGYNAYFVSDCEQVTQYKDAYKKVRYYDAQVQAAHITVGAIEKAADDAGLEPLLGDLRPALLTALTSPDARERWLNGEAVFRSA